MIRNLALTLALLIASHLRAVSPEPVPDPGYHHTHFKIHVPYEVHTVHHHHVQKIPIIKEVPVIKEIPIIKTVPIVKTVGVPIEKPVFVPLPIKEHYGYSSFH